MPSGRVHSAATTMVLVTTGICASGILTTNSDFACFAAGHALGYLIGPDLDVNGGNISSAYVRRIPAIGFLLSKLWYFYWLPYALIMPHRSVASHFPVVSTTIRLGYIFLTTLPFRMNWSWMSLSNRQMIFIFLGLVVVDTAHWLMDNAGGNDTV